MQPAGARDLALTEAEVSSMVMLGISRDQLEVHLTRENLHRFTMPQLKTISTVLAGRLPPRFALRGTKAVQVAQLAHGLWGTPQVAAEHPPRSAPAPAPAAAPRPVTQPTSQHPVYTGTPTPSSTLNASERDLIRAALHPYYESLTQLVVTRVTSLRVANSSHYQLRFRVDNATMAQLNNGRGSFVLLIRFFKDLTGTSLSGLCIDTYAKDVQWWNDFSVILNGKTVDVRHCKKIRSTTKNTSFITPSPVDIASRVVSGTNLIEFYYHNWASTYIAVVELARRRDLKELISIVPGIKGSASFVPSAHGEELEELKQMLPLLCPITMSRIQIPAKGRLCSHLQAFDLGTFISFSNNAQQWNCPICQKSLPFHQLVRDEMIAKILADTTKETECVELDQSGKWTLGTMSVPIDASDNDSEESHKRTRPQEGGLRKTMRVDALLRNGSSQLSQAPAAAGQNGHHPAGAFSPKPAAATIIVIDSD